MSKKSNHILEMIQSKYPGYHPLMSIAEIAHAIDPNVTPELRFQCHKTIAKFIEPEMKSIQVSNTDNSRRVTISMFGEEDAEVIDIVNDSRPLVTVR